MMNDTIFALSTVPGRSGIAVIRMSGPNAKPALDRVTGDQPLPPDRKAGLRRIIDPDAGEIIDQGLVLAFSGPRSFTGEDMVEIHGHGGRAVVDRVLAVLGATPGLRPAEPGEFTRRAFDNGRLDLTEVEGLADLIDAETAAQHRQALRQMDGALGRLYEGWRLSLSRALAYAEADLDFPDEDLPDGVTESLAPTLVNVAAAIRTHLSDARRGERVRSGFEIAVLGRPNAGKSSLVNQLAQRDAAIVSAVAGTTRDVVEVHLDLSGYAVVVADTAGMRESGDDIELEGVRRARLRADTADLRLLVIDACDLQGVGQDVSQGVTDSARPLTMVIPGDLVDLVTPDTVIVINKIDTIDWHVDWESLGRLASSGQNGPQCESPVIGISASSGTGVSDLIDLVVAMVRDRLDGDGGPPLTRARHRDALETCVEALDRAMIAPLPELAAEDLRLAVRALGRITGRVDVEDILDIVFRDFCIGK